MQPNEDSMPTDASPIAPVPGRPARTDAGAAADGERAPGQGGERSLRQGRRRLLWAGSLAAAALCTTRPALAALAPGREEAEALAGPADARRLSLYHTHTRESLSLTYAIGDAYLPGALAEADRFLRDHYSGEIGRIDAALLDRLHAVGLALGVPARFEVISGYRGPATNEMLRRRSRGVARDSLHMQGRAIDVRMPGVDLRALCDAALDLRAGGVGFYPESAFVHLDTGRVRSW